MWTWLLIGGFLSAILFLIILGIVGDELDDDSIVGAIITVLTILGFIATFIGLEGSLISSACKSDDRLNDRLIKEKAELVEQLETVKSKELLDVVVKEAYDWNKDHDENEELIIDIDDILLHRENTK